MQLFKKKKPEEERSAKQISGNSARPSAIERIKALYSQGLSEIEIIKTLRKEGYKPGETDKAMDQALKEIAAGESKKLKTQVKEKEESVSVQITEGRRQIAGSSVKVSRKPVPVPKTTPKVTVSVYDSEKKSAMSKPPSPPIPKKIESPKTVPKPPAKTREYKEERLSELRKEIDEVKSSSKKKEAEIEMPVVNISIFDSDKDKSEKAPSPKKPSIRPAPKPPPRKASPKPAPEPSPPAPKPGITKDREIEKLRETVTSMKKDMRTVKIKIGKVPEKKHVEEIKKILKSKPPAPPVKKPSPKPKPPAKPLKAKATSFTVQPEKREKATAAAFSPESRKKATAAAFKPVSAKLMVTKSDVRRLEAGISGIRKELKKPKPAAKPIPKISKKESAKKPSPKPRKAKPGKSAKVPKSEDMKTLKESVRFLDKSVTRLSKDIVKMDEKIPDRKEMEEMKSSGLSESDIKSVRQMLANASYSDSQSAGLQIKIDKISSAIDSFSERFDNLQREFTQIKIGKAGSSSGEGPGLRERIDRIEKSIENLKDSRARPAESRSVSDLAARVEEIERMSSQEKARPLQVKDSLDRNASERLDTVDSRITGINDKLMQLSGDAQKLSSYFMDAIRHLDEKIRVLEKSREYPEPPPRSFREAPRTIREIPEAPSRPPPKPEPLPEIEPKPLELPRLPPAPVREVPSTIFTKLREGTVEKRPFPRISMESDDMEVLKEHILESLNRGESRDKISRDLYNAGYEQDAIEKAFMQARVG